MDKPNQQIKNKICSVILPVYNSERYLNRTVNSVLQQTMTDFELLAIDDCSTDSSVQLLERWAEKKTAACKLSAMGRIKAWPLCAIRVSGWRKASISLFGQ